MSGEDGNSHTRLEIGRTLERARRERGLSLQQIEQATKIRAKYLRDLENENFDVLPAVYVLGSLKTYAGYLGLDGEALAGELKRRQALLQERQDEAREEPAAGEPRGLLASLGRLFGLGSDEAVEDEAGAVPDPGHSPRLYLSLGVVLIFVVAIALASTLRTNDEPAISQVREPKTPQAPSRVALVGNLQADERDAGDHSKDKRHEEKAGVPVRDKRDRAERSDQDEDASQTAQVSSASAFASASVNASAGASAASASTSASTGPASVTATPAGASQEPAATQEPENNMAGSAPSDSSSGGTGPAPVSPQGGNGVAGPQKRTAPMDATLLGDKIRSKVRSAVGMTR